MDLGKMSPPYVTALRSRGKRLAMTLVYMAKPCVDKNKTTRPGLGCSLVREYLLSMCDMLGLHPSITHTKSQG